jgi:3-oxoacyl-[acyl-carrier protein] reductase
LKTLLLSGGTRGIGLALAKSFLGQGWKVSVSYHADEASAQEASQEFSKISPDFQVVKADVSRETEVQAWVQGAMESWGRLDCVLHNAGSTWNARLLNVEEPEWDATMDVHLKGAYLLSRAALKPMLKQKDGHFIFISSIVATTGNIGQGSYAAAKAGVLGFARSLAQEYGGRNLRANVVFPGFHKTKIADNLSPEAAEAIRKRHLLGRTADLQETTQFLVWLAGTKNISGQVFNLDSRLPGWL